MGAETAVTIDLGGVFAVKRITTDLFGNESWGIPSPDAASVTFLVSEDGESFVPFGAGAAEEQSEADGWQRAVFACTAETPVRASHVRVVYGIGGSFCWVSEINAFGVEAGSAPEERGRFRVRPRFGVVRRSAGSLRSRKYIRSRHRLVCSAFHRRRLRNRDCGRIDGLLPV